ncbi:ribosomal RNA small subunit methyltransferase, chloroplastic isoform X2 [Nymphaea colorata]|uniref:ribosomal RNA small subunit methyltransferase, chloroplastic isoform X2 n=1 Tax=Nymphaea colorata TaxID=210225 RepID=UPI00214EB1C1|nr:ribosomal RNA small subunit methyltransferase, chloroplastic isoform X2 [Nymphaea colorata]
MVSLAHTVQLPVHKWGSCGLPYKPSRTSFYVVGSNRDDDYHATLRALKARGRTPRRSLGQDPHMAMHVRERFGDMGHVMVLQEDFTRCHIRSHMESLLEKTSKEGSGYAKVVSNIPFNISTEVIKQLLPMGDIFSEVVLLLQDETALRLVDASLRTSEYRPVNIFVNFYSEPEYKFKVSRTNFFPQPNVDGAIAKFKLKQPSDYPQVTSTKTFFSMVNAAFNGKRKMLRRSLQHLSTPAEIENALENLGLLVTSRPEELTLDDFVGLHNFLFKGKN